MSRRRIYLEYFGGILFGCTGRGQKYTYARGSDRPWSLPGDCYIIAVTFLRNLVYVAHSHVLNVAVRSKILLLNKRPSPCAQTVR